MAVSYLMAGSLSDTITKRLESEADSESACAREDQDSSLMSEAAEGWKEGGRTLTPFLFHRRYCRSTRPRKKKNGKMRGQNEEEERCQIDTQQAFWQLLSTSSFSF